MKSSRTQTPEEIEADCFSLLGRDLGRLCYALIQDYWSVRLKWQEYREAFGTSPARVDLFNSAGAAFFRVTQDALWNDMLLDLCHLTDPVKSRNKENLTLQRLRDGIGDEELRREVEALVGQAIKDTEFARDWRNRQVAHRDLDLALSQGAKPLK